MYLSYDYLFPPTKVRLFSRFSQFFTNIRSRAKKDANFNISQIVENQAFAEKLQIHPKKNQKKRYVVLKKCLTLQRFNKQMIVLQI